METGDLAWTLAIEERSGTETVVLEGTELSGARLRIMVMPHGGETVVIEVEGIAWPLGDDETHPVALRLPSGARWPAHLRVVGPETMQVLVPAHGGRLLAGLRAARWMRIEHQEHLLMLTLPPRSAVDALQALARGDRSDASAVPRIAAVLG